MLGERSERVVRELRRRRLCRSRRTGSAPRRRRRPRLRSLRASPAYRRARRPRAHAALRAALAGQRVCCGIRRARHSARARAARTRRATAMRRRRRCAVDRCAGRGGAWPRRARDWRSRSHRAGRPARCCRPARFASRADNSRARSALYALRIGVVRVQQIEQQDGRQLGRDAAARELAQIQKALVVGIRAARQHDGGDVGQAPGQRGLDELPQPVREQVGLEHSVRRGRWRAAAASENRQESRCANELDGHGRPRHHDRARSLAASRPSAQNGSSNAARSSSMALALMVTSQIFPAARSRSIVSAL